MQRLGLKAKLLTGYVALDQMPSIARGFIKATFQHKSSRSRHEYQSIWVGQGPDRFKITAVCSAQVFLGSRFKNDDFMRQVGLHLEQL